MINRLLVIAIVLLVIAIVVMLMAITYINVLEIKIYVVGRIELRDLWYITGSFARSLVIS